MKKIPFERSQDLKRLKQTADLNHKDIWDDISFEKSKYYYFSRLNMKSGVYFTSKEEFVIHSIIKRKQLPTREKLIKIGNGLKEGIVSALRDKGFSSCEMDLMLKGF